MYKSSHSTLIANSVTEPPCTVNAQMDQEHYVEHPGRANVVASVISGESTQNTKMAEATIETFTAMPSASTPPPTSVGANVVESEITGNSTQKLPGQSPKNGEMAAATIENSTATASATAPFLQHQ
jgi:hypothetical protein